MLYGRMLICMFGTNAVMHIYKYAIATEVDSLGVQVCTDAGTSTRYQVPGTGTRYSEYSVFHIQFTTVL